LAALGNSGLAVAERLARELNLQLPEAPWRTHRDRIAEAASVFVIIAGSCGKIARDVSLMMQTDVAEAFEPSGEGRGGSSTLPHKRNRVSASCKHGPQSRSNDFRGAGAGSQTQRRPPWHAEWPTLPSLMLVTSGALAAIVDIAEGLEVDVAHMRASLDATSG
jgi:3-carboxy-cis,cis-muconate cycloisomerase